MPAGRDELFSGTDDGPERSRPAPALQPRPPGTGSPGQRAADAAAAAAAIAVVIASHQQDAGGRDQREHVDVEQIMREIRARIAKGSGIDITNQQIHELAARRLEAILDPRTIKPALLEQLRRGAAAAELPATPAPPPLEVKEESLFDSFMRRLLRPLFATLAPILQAFRTQDAINKEAAAREAAANRRQAEWNALQFELLQRMVTETARVSIEMQSLALRIESLGGQGRLQRARACGRWRACRSRRRQIVGAPARAARAARPGAAPRHPGVSAAASSGAVRRAASGTPPRATQPPRHAGAAAGRAATDPATATRTAAPPRTPQRRRAAGRRIWRRGWRSPGRASRRRAANSATTDAETRPRGRRAGDDEPPMPAIGGGCGASTGPAPRAVARATPRAGVDRCAAARAGAAPAPARAADRLAAGDVSAQAGASPRAADAAARRSGARSRTPAAARTAGSRPGRSLILGTAA